MNESTGLIISSVSALFAIFLGLYNLFRKQKIDNQQSAAEMTTVIVKLENINMGINEIKREMNVLKEEFKQTRERVIILEQCIKEIYKRIEKIEKGG